MPTARCRSSHTRRSSRHFRALPRSGNSSRRRCLSRSSSTTERQSARSTIRARTHSLADWRIRTNESRASNATSAVPPLRSTSGIHRRQASTCSTEASSTTLTTTTTATATTTTLLSLTTPARDLLPCSCHRRIRLRQSRSFVLCLPL